MKCVLKFGQVWLEVGLLSHFLTVSVMMHALVMIVFSNADYLLILFRISVGLIHSGVGVYTVEYVCNRVVVDVLMLSYFDAFVKCSFWSEMFPYESKRYFVRSMMLQSRNLESSLVLVMST